MESYSFDKPLRLTSGSSSINTDKEEELDKVSEREGVSTFVSKDSFEFSWASRFSYHIQLGLTYKLRRFSSKGALLLLILNFFISAGYGVPAGNGNSYHFYEGPHGNSQSDNYPDEPPWTLRDIIPILIWSPAILVLGLLADIRYGRKRIVMFGIILLWVVVIVDCIRATVYYYTPHFPQKSEIFHAIFLVDAVLSYIATAAFLVNSVQLAIDQLSDQSTNQVSSFIQWHLFTYFLGAWVFSQFTQGPIVYCLHLNAKKGPRHMHKVLANLVQVILVSIAVCLVAICGGWITPSPIRSNPLKLIWKVLKFAAKHKYPVSRSAFTYWEDEIPSRINLGKDKYGGPFTNEQVEDVKTFFRMLLIALPCIVISSSCILMEDNFVYSPSQNLSINTLMDFNYSGAPWVENNECIQSLYAAFLANINVWICLYVLISELIIYPLISRCIPSMLRRIGFAYFLIIPLSIILLIMNIVAFATNSFTVQRLPLYCTITAIAALQYYIVISSFLEFICAQSPQSMKGFMIGFMWVITVIIVVISYFIYYAWSLKCIGPGCGTGYFSLVTLFSVAGFVVYCVVAKRYRLRERDDCPNNQAIVEEVFARRLANERKFRLEHSSCLSEVY